MGLKQVRSNGVHYISCRFGIGLWLRIPLETWTYIRVPFATGSPSCRDPKQKALDLTYKAKL
jgi:hypothetical protein